MKQWWVVVSCLTLWTVGIAAQQRTAADSEMLKTWSIRLAPLRG
jgi:hypothetical protein